MQRAMDETERRRAKQVALTKPMALSQRLFARPYPTSWKAQGPKRQRRKVETRRDAAAKKKGDMPADALPSPDQVEQQIVALEKQMFALEGPIGGGGRARQDRAAKGPLRSNLGRPTFICYISAPRKGASWLKAPERTKR